MNMAESMLTLESVSKKGMPELMTRSIDAGVMSVRPSSI